MTAVSSQQSAVNSSNQQSAAFNSQHPSAALVNKSSRICSRQHLTDSQEQTAAVSNSQHKRQLAIVATILIQLSQQQSAARNHHQPPTFNIGLQATTSINSQQQSIGRSKQHNNNSNHLSPAIDTRNQQLSTFSNRRSTAANNCQQSTINSQQRSIAVNNYPATTTISQQLTSVKS